MAVYSVYLQGDGLQSIAEAAFVREAFNWKAFFFGPLWLLRHRLWVGLTFWSAAYLILIIASPTVLSNSASVTIAFAIQFLLGLEANRLIEAKLAARGYHLVEIVAAPALDQAEAAFYRHVETPDTTTAGS
jgi:Protein of unknown function (DUF2628)